MNIPIGAFICGLLLLVHPKRPNTASSLRDFLQSLDLIGLAALTPSMVCLLLALQFGGTVYPWDNGRVIALLVLFALFGVGFCRQRDLAGGQSHRPRAHYHPTHHFCGLCCMRFCSNSASVVVMYFLPM